MGKIITVDFRQDTLFAVERDNGVFVAVTPICQSMGIDPQKQRARIQADPILSEGVYHSVLPSSGGSQEAFCLRMDLLNGWLFSINDKLVRDPDAHAKVLSYKRECYAVLFSHFYGRMERPAVGELIEPQARAEEPEGPKVKMVTEARHTFGVPAAAQLWFKLGLPSVPAMYHDPRQMELIDYSRIKTNEAA